MAELKPEMLARVQFLATATEDKTGAAKERERLFALASALQRDGAKATAWMVDKGGHTVWRKTVTVGSGRLGEWVEISEGLQPGDTLVAGDTSRLHDGERVRIVGEVDATSAAPAEMGGDHGAH